MRMKKANDPSDFLLQRSDSPMIRTRGLQAGECTAVLLLLFSNDPFVEGAGNSEDQHVFFTRF